MSYDQEQEIKTLRAMVEDLQDLNCRLFSTLESALKGSGVSCKLSIPSSRVTDKEKLYQ